MMSSQPEVSQTVTDRQERSIDATACKGMALTDSCITYTQRTGDSVKKIDYDYKRCCGCGICASLCPTGALELGDMCAIGTGLEVPPVLMDPDKCSFCGMCAAFCPTKAVKMDIDGKDSVKRDCYPHIDPKAQPNEFCIPCSLCEQVCSSGAITVEYTFPKKEAIAPLKAGVTGEISIDQEKCNFCGICAYFCDAFILIPKDKGEITPADPVPFENILIDEAVCDYCVLCEDICPEDAIKVTGTREVAAPRVSGTLSVGDNCVACGWCKSVCPYDAIDVFKPFEGDIRLIENHLARCDPLGCHACFNVCPANAWYIPVDKKIEVSPDRCTFCGACERACWIDVIAVNRTGVMHTPLCDTAWSEEWKRGIESIVSGTGTRTLPDRSHVIVAPAPEREAAPVPAMPVIDPALLARAQERIDRIMPMLSDVRTRRAWERLL